VRTLLGTIAVALLVLVTSAPAIAETVSITDRRGDVLEGRVGEPGGYARQADVREGDVVRTTFRHGPRNIVVTSWFRALDFVGARHGYFLRLQTARRVYREVDVEAQRGMWRGRLTVTDARGHRVACRATRRIDYRANTVRVVVPRSCLGRPKLVRGTAANAWTRPDPTDASAPDILSLDNPHNTAADANTWTRWLKRSR
jgi:hypothetical protein